MKVRFTFWQEADGKYLGYLNEFPDYWTQGESLKDLEATCGICRACPVS